MKKDKDSFAVLYCSGMWGTWLTWFINQHKNFPQYNNTKIYVNGLHTDFACNGATWCFTVDTEDGAQDTPMTYEEYVENWLIPERKNHQATKNCMKLLPDHDWTWDNHYNNDELIRRVFSHINGIILPYLPEDSPFLEMMDARNKFMWDQHIEFDMDDFWIEAANNSRKQIRNHYYDKFSPYASQLVLNIHNLFMCDENEYNALIEFIGEEPLKDWEQLVNNYRQTIVCKDWTKLKKEIQEKDEPTDF